MMHKARSTLNVHSKYLTSQLEMGCFEVFSPNDGHSKMTQKIGHPVQAKQILFLQN